MAITLRARRVEPDGSAAGRGRLVVVGAGMVAVRFCEHLARTGHPFASVALLGDEGRLPYDRIHLARILKGEPADRLELRSPRFFEEAGIEARSAAEVTHVDLEARLVSLANGEAVAFESLVFATGSTPIRPPIEGIEELGVDVLRSADDAEQIATAVEKCLERGERIAVLGGGLLGVEIADAIRLRGASVEIFERAARLLPRQLDRQASLALERSIRARGLGLRLGTQVVGIDRRGGGVALRFSDGSRLGFGRVIVAAGVSPRDELARAAGIRCAERGGIEVDDGLQTSAPGVFAIGECARHADRLYGLAAPGYAMAEALAARLGGGRVRFRPVAPATRLKVSGLEVSVVGDTESEGLDIARTSHVDGDDYRSVVIRRGRIVGAVTVGAWDEWFAVQESVSRRRRVGARALARLLREGRLWPERRAQRPISGWDDGALVCTCMGVDCGALRRAVAGGACSAVALRDATGASSVCGSCEPLLQALTGEADETARVGPGPALAIASAVGIVGALALAFGTPIPFSETVQQPLAGRFGLDSLWREPWLRQTTGYTALALVAVSLLFSLRKRSKWLSAFSFTGWRSLHAVLGASALLCVGVHTGLRLGSNLDRALVLSFLALGVVGALAGLATSLEARLRPEHGPRLRRISGWVHAALFWPFPALLAFHVLKVYWY